MKSYLIDVPVSLNVFIRPHTLSKVFQVIKRVRPSILFLVSDGPRINVTSDKKNIDQSRSIVEDIDWDCKIYKLYSDQNQGMYRTYFEAQKFIFSLVDRCIFLEDDVLVSDSFFYFCEVLLEKYKNDLRVHYVTGMNYLGEYEEPDGDYFFCGEGSIWGYATWKRTYINQNLNYIDNNYAIKRINMVSQQIKKGYDKLVTGYSTDSKYCGHIPGPEFYKNLLRFSQNQIFIVPTKNMVCNIGIGEGSTHSSNDIKKLPKGIQKLFYMDIHEYDFPLKEPEFVIRDLFYEKCVDRILAWNNPYLKMYRKLDSMIRHIYYGDIKIVKKKISAYLRKTEEM